jgi:hypothetical protein
MEIFSKLYPEIEAELKEQCRQQYLAARKMESDELKKKLKKQRRSGKRRS